MEFGSSFGFAVYEEWGGFNECRNIIGMILKLQHGISILQGITKQFDQRSLAAKRRKQALSKATDVMLDMLKTAIKAGHSAKYAWFSNPKDILRIHNECGMNTIVMIKKSSKVFYEFKGSRMNVKQIYGMCKKRRVISCTRTG